MVRLCASFRYSQKYANDADITGSHPPSCVPVSPCWTDTGPASSHWGHRTQSFMLSSPIGGKWSFMYLLCVLVKATWWSRLQLIYSAILNTREQPLHLYFTLSRLFYFRYSTSVLAFALKMTGNLQKTFPYSLLPSLLWKGRRLVATALSSVSESFVVFIIHQMWGQSVHLLFTYW